MDKGKTEMKDHFKSNGNGKLEFSKFGLAMLMAIISIISMLMPAVFAYGKLNNRVDNLEVVWNDAQSEHPDYVNSVEIRLDDHEKSIIKMGVILEEIRDDIQEIKDDIKDIKKELKEVN